MSNQSDMLKRGLEELGVNLSDAQQQHLLDYLDLLYKWNRAYNLTAIRDREQAVALQLLDSLAILPELPDVPLLDVGSGGGLPGIPLAIARPNTAVVLLDANSKKTRFLTQVRLELGLENVEVVHARLESWEPRELPGAITCRAFAELAQIVDWAERFLTRGVPLFAMKGQYPGEEIARLDITLYDIETVALQVPGVEAARHLVRVSRRND